MVVARQHVDRTIESEHNLGRNIYLVNYAARLTSLPFRLVCTRSRRRVSGETVVFVCGTCVEDTIASGRWTGPVGQHGQMAAGLAIWPPTGNRRPPVATFSCSEISWPLSPPLRRLHREESTYRSVAGCGELSCEGGVERGDLKAVKCAGDDLQSGGYSC